MNDVEGHRERLRKIKIIFSCIGIEDSVLIYYPHVWEERVCRYHETYIDH